MPPILVKKHDHNYTWHNFSLTTRLKALFDPYRQLIYTPCSQGTPMIKWFLLQLSRWIQFRFGANHQIFKFKQSHCYTNIRQGFYLVSITSRYFPVFPHDCTLSGLFHCADHSPQQVYDLVNDLFRRLIYSFKIHHNRNIWE